MGWPQYTIIAISVLSSLFILENHGKPRKGKDDIGIHSFAVLLSHWLLWMGGFYGS